MGNPRVHIHSEVSGSTLAVVKVKKSIGMQIKYGGQNKVPNEGCRWNVLGVSRQNREKQSTYHRSSHSVKLMLRQGFCSLH
jgi:hypothetical protein